MASPPASGLLLPLSPGGGGTANPNSNNNNNSSGVKKCGYLRKHKHGHKRFFVLREAGGEGGGGGPARLEYYESEKKWRQKAAAAKRSIALDSCLNINKRADAKHKHLIALYTRDEYFALAADSEQEQESWYRALTELLSEGRAGGGGGGGGSCPDGPFPGHPSCSSSPASSSSCCLLSGAEDLNYGLITPASAAYREVWQVTLKPKGLGQSRNLTGVHRLCLSARAVAFVRLNAQAPAVTLQLSNVRRCGHSDSFFFVEVGRSAATGPGELWMQADDAVVAQNIHETILEAMRAMRELAEFRPRSKSQSSSSSSSASNPITVPGRRHLNHPPPSQTGLARRSRTDSSSSSATAASSSSSPASKFTSCRMRTASEGDGRPGPASGSPLSPGAARPQHLSRSNTLGGRQGPKMAGPAGGLAHSRSSSSSIMPASQSPPAATSPVSLSSSSGHGSASDPLPRPFSCSASASGSPSDGGFLSLDEYGSSPGPRSATPESLAAGTTPPPPGREGAGELCGYMVMERPLRGGWRRPCREEAEAEKAQRKRTYSLTTPARQRAAPQLSSASLDERTLRAASSPKLPYHPYPEDYGDVEIGSSGSNSSSSNHHLAADDGGYMPMTPGAAPPAGQAPKGEDYVPMSPTSVSAPKLILQPRPCPQQQHLHHHQRPLNGHKSASPAGSSPEDSGYMRMWCGSRLSVESPAGGGDYMNMSPHDHNCASVTPPDFFGGGGAHLPKPAPPASLCYGAPLPAKKGDSDQYVFMNSPGQRIAEELARPPPPPPIIHHHHHHAVPSPDAFFQRAARPTRLALDTVRTLPSMHEHPLPPEPGSPGEYINIDFGRGAPPPPPPSQSPASSLGSGHHHQRSPLSDYMNLGFGSHSPKGGLASPGSPEEEEAMSPAPARPFLPAADGDYTEMTFGAAATPPQPIAAQKPDGAQLDSPAAGVKRLTLVDQRPGGGGGAAEAFARPPDPDRGAKVIRADPQGRRRHSSETFSSTTTVTPVSPSFAHNPKRHNSASVENVSLRKGEEGPGGGQEGPGGGAGGASPMCRHTSAGFQNGLNYIAIDVAEESRGFAAVAALHGLDIGAYARLGFGRHGLKEATAVKE